MTNTLPLPYNGTYEYPNSRQDNCSISVRIITQPNDNILSSALNSILCNRTAANVSFVRDDSANIEIAISGIMKKLSSESRLWALVWSDGRPFIHLGGLVEACGCASSVAEIHLLEYYNREWRSLRTAAFSVSPGNLPETLSLAAEYAARVVSQALHDVTNSVSRMRRTKIIPRIMDQPALERVSIVSGARFLWQRLYKKIINVVFHENWMIGIIDAPISSAVTWDGCPPVRWIGHRSPYRYFADPFAWPDNPDTILCEEYCFDTRLGVIKKLEIHGDAIKSESMVDLSVPGHLSFPFLFRHDGEVYCMPESSGAHRLTIFRWDKVNAKWLEVVSPLRGIAAADSILFRYGGYFWIAYTDTAINHFNNLNLCFAPSLNGPWQPHVNNPIKIDPRSSRCGGGVFMHMEKLYRPAQDCSVRYGGSIRIMEILECTPTSFHEEEVTVIKPELGENPHGFHTMSPCGNKTLIDGKRMMWSWQDILDKAWRRVSAWRA